MRKTSTKYSISPFRLPLINRIFPIFLGWAYIFGRACHWGGEGGQGRLVILLVIFEFCFSKMFRVYINLEEILLDITNHSQTH